MKEREEGRGSHRAIDRRAAARATACVFLGAVVVVVGVVGYLALEATAPVGTSPTIVHGCTPAGSASCKALGNTTSAMPEVEGSGGPLS